jgi:acetamidase/formamidase
MAHFTVDSTSRHLVWDNQIPPAVTVEPGDEIDVVMVDASGAQISSSDGDEAVASLDFGAVNPCTGPIKVVGAKPGMTLLVEFLELEVGSWAWTANIPGFGLLADEFPDPRLWISSVGANSVATPIGVEIPKRAMIGTIGVPGPQTGSAPLLVPTQWGGNMDIAQVGRGATLSLPVGVEGALLSMGDAHAVQGDGEVCGTGAETSATARCRISLADREIETPTLTYQASAQPEIVFATTGIGPDLLTASREASLRAVDHLSRQLRIDPIDAYLLLSLVGELRISEVVDAPNWVVTMHIDAQMMGG